MSVFVEESSKIKKFVISGGPCAGKTTAMERLQVFLRERGFRVFVVQEAATILLLNGAFFSDLAKPECELAFQQFVIKIQMQLEDSIYNYAVQTGEESVILCDRGVMDGSAYVTKDQWSTVLNGLGVEEGYIRNSRYNGVFHLVTAADGAEEFYSLANNKARSESVEAAIEQDRKTQVAWAGHHHHVIIDNRNTFEEKMERLVSLIARSVGLPSLARRATQFPVLKPPVVENIPDVQTFFIEKIMLENELHVDTQGSPSNITRKDREASSVSLQDICPAPANDGQGTVLYSFIRRRSQAEFHSYGLTTVKRLASGEKVELKQVITGKVYEFLKRSLADPTRNIIRQKRYYFLYNKQSFQLYEYLEPEKDMWTLYCQSQGEISLPPFLEVGRERGDTETDGHLSSYMISKKSADDLANLSLK